MGRGGSFTATAISSRFDYEGGKGGDIASSVCAQTRAVSFIYLSACSPVFYLPIIFRPRNTVYVTTVTIPLFELLLLERKTEREINRAERRIIRFRTDSAVSRDLQNGRGLKRIVGFSPSSLARKAIGRLFAAVSGTKWAALPVDCRYSSSARET